MLLPARALCVATAPRFDDADCTRGSVAWTRGERGGVAMLLCAALESLEELCALQME